MQPTTYSSRLHIFAISISTTADSSRNITAPMLSVRRVRSTSRWEVVDGVRAQVVEVTLANLTPQIAFSQQTSVTSRHEVEVIGPGLTTVVPGVIHRLVASDQVRVEVLVEVARSCQNARIRIKDSLGNVFSDDATMWPVSPLLETWTADATVLSTHETPTWVRIISLLVLRIRLTRTFVSGTMPNLAFCGFLYFNG